MDGVGVSGLLYAPVLAPDAIPPLCVHSDAPHVLLRLLAAALELGARRAHACVRCRNYPPSFTSRKAVGLCAAICAALGAAEATAAFWPPSSLRDPWAQHVSRFLNLLLLVVVGYVYVSLVTLGRRGWLGSRYTSAAVSAEFLKLALAAPVCYYLLQPALSPLCGGGGGGGSVGASAGCGGHLPLLEFVLPFFIGLHFVYLDNSQFLQEFGCKWPVAAAWRSMTPSELAFGGAVVLGLGAFAAAQLEELLAAPGDAQLRLVLVYGGAAAAFTAVSLRLRSTHHVHFHHYLSGALLLPLAGFATRLSCVVGALCLAVFTEGCAVWGMDPIWVRSPPTTDR